MAEQLPILMLLSPFLFAFTVSLTGLVNSRWCYPLTLVAVTLSLFASAGLLGQVLEHPDHRVHYHLGGWPPPFGIAYVIDPLNAVVLVLVAVVALITAVYSKDHVPRDTPGKEPQFYTLYLLLLTGLLGMTVTGDAFNLYVFLEISSLTSYALIAIGPPRAALSTFNYIIMGTIGASFILLGIGYLYLKTGSLNMADMHRIIGGFGPEGSKTIRIGFILIMIGVWIKMALFPLHRWLPNAYTFAPTSSGCLIAPLMTKVSVYVMIRFMFTVFYPEVIFASPENGDIVLWLAVIGILVGSFYALAKIKLKKMLAYLILAEVGYMVGGAWQGNETGLTGAVFHLLSDGLMTLCLFLVAGIFLHKRQSPNISAMRGAFSRMPFTMAGFTVAALSMIGVPPTCGFFSKWYLISGGIEAGRWSFVVALLISSLVNAILFFKIIEQAFFDRPFETDNHRETTIDEAPPSMLFPLLITAALILLLGIFSSKVVAFISIFITSTGGS